MKKATVQGEIFYRAGDGPLMRVPDGQVDIDVADDSATLGWKDSNGALGSAAITKEEYERYVREGKLTHTN